MLIDEFCAERFMPPPIQDQFIEYVVSKIGRLEDLTGQQIQHHWGSFIGKLPKSDWATLIICAKEGLIAYAHYMVRLPEGLRVKIELIPGVGFHIYWYGWSPPTVIGWN